MTNISIKRERNYNKTNFRQRAGRKRSGIRRHTAKSKCAQECGHHDNLSRKHGRGDLPGDRNGN
jgi:hypothetical protein